VSPVAHPLSTKLHQPPGLRFGKNRNGSNPTAVTVLTSSRDLQPGQQGVVLTVRGSEISSAAAAQDTRR